MAQKNILVPRPKKNIVNFLTEEDGKIAKKDLAKLGIVIAISAIAASGAMKPKDASAVCAHANHGSHGSHGSHWSSHGSHGSHSSSW